MGHDENVGVGPYAVERDEDTWFYHLTREGVRTGKSYPLGKTANRTARKLNDAESLTRAVLGPHEAAPQVTASPATGGDAGAGDAPASPKAPKSRKARADVRVTPDPFGKDAPPSSIPNPRKRFRVKDAQPKREPAPAPELTPAAIAGKAGHSAVIFNGSREEWLNALVASHRPHFERVGYPLPEKIRVSVGFPLNSRKGKVIGVCYRVEASSDGVNEIFVTPTLDDSAKLAEVLTHELAHAATPGDKHGPTFGKCVRALGLEGKLTATVAGEGWHEWADPILEALGPIPHAALNPFEHAKKQTTRLLKGECLSCGFVVRLTAKWVNKAEGSLQCPDSACGGDLDVTGGDE